MIFAISGMALVCVFHGQAMQPDFRAKRLDIYRQSHRVHNLTVQTDHSYFATHNQLLAHNSSLHKTQVVKIWYAALS